MQRIRRKLPWVAGQLSERPKLEFRRLESELSNFVLDADTDRPHAGRDYTQNGTLWNQALAIEPDADHVLQCGFRRQHERVGFGFIECGRIASEAVIDHYV